MNLHHFLKKHHNHCTLIYISCHPLSVKLAAGLCWEQLGSWVGVRNSLSPRLLLRKLTSGRDVSGNHRLQKAYKNTKTCIFGVGKVPFNACNSMQCLWIPKNNLPCGNHHRWNRISCLRLRWVLSTWSWSCCRNWMPGTASNPFISQIRVQSVSLRSTLQGSITACTYLTCHN